MDIRFSTRDILWKFVLIQGRSYGRPRNVHLSEERPYRAFLERSQRTFLERPHTPSLEHLYKPFLGYVFWVNRKKKTYLQNIVFKRSKKCFLSLGNFFLHIFILEAVTRNF